MKRFFEGWTVGTWALFSASLMLNLAFAIFLLPESPDAVGEHAAISVTNPVTIARDTKEMQRDLEATSLPPSVEQFQRVESLASE